MRTIRDTTHTAHGQALSRDVFVPMTQPVISDQPAGSLFVMHLPPMDPTQKPAHFLDPPFYISVACCCCVATYNTCARTVPPLVNLWNLFCINNQRALYSTNFCRSCCAGDIPLATDAYCCQCKAAPNQLSSRRVVVTATHDTGVLQGGQVC